MSDIIHLLPDSIANQIAAGEVIQRPSSVVKELIENAIDSGATKIQLIIKSAGKALIQVVDNGSGMSETDVRMAFERHATSKLRSADDLFAITTMGFRGEALASIAAVAQVSIKTRLESDDTGTELQIEGSKVISQKAIACESGTSVSVKNLFYNVPARRNFLKSDNVETKHILDEFHRTALAYPEISFECFHNENIIYQVQSGNLRQRINGLFGKQFNERIVPVEEHTSIVNVTGFTGKPEFARRTRGEQFFFVNGRFIRDPYLHHAVRNAYDEMLPENTYPSYFIYFEIDPAQIDVNVHPTKTEIKFQDEKSIYAIVRAAVKQALGKFNLTPSIDFDVETSFEIPWKKQKDFPSEPQIKVNTSYNPFAEEGTEHIAQRSESTPDTSMLQFDEEELNVDLECFQIKNSYLCCRIDEQLVVIDQQRAHERILYERNIEYLRNNNGPSQQSLFPVQLKFNADEYELLKEIEPMLRSLGFDLSEFSAETFVVHGTPVWLETGSEKELFDHLVEQIKMKSNSFKVDQMDWLAITLARKSAIKRGQKLQFDESVVLIKELLDCSNPNFDASGKIVMFKMDERFLNAQFDHKTQSRQL